MTFQLRRMILVNAGTNTGRASGRITEIDPRGGAAVIGPNGVGKTSTLRLIPLFFGHPTSEAVAVNQGQEGVKFILPSQTSAICFEYQRGSDAAENLRLAVMRAKSDADAPEYRIFPCGYNQDMFIRDGRFLTDEDTTAVATAAGAIPTWKLSTAQYRAVILGSRVYSKDQWRIQAYARNHSFGPRELPNLDKLVATVVKDKVNFQDLVQVAVGLVLADRGGEHRQRLTFRQQRKQLEDWLRNRDAAAAAVAAGSRVTALSGMLLDFDTAQQEWRNRHFEVLELTTDRTARRQADGDALETAQGRLATLKKEDGQLEEELKAKLHAASDKAAAADLDHKAALNEQRYFVDNEAEDWAVRLQMVPALRTDLDGLRRQRELAAAKVQDAEQRYTQQVQEIEKQVAEQIRALQASKEPLHGRFDAERRTLDEQRGAAQAEAGELSEARRSELQERLAPLQEKLGDCKRRRDNPEAPGSLLDALNASRQKHQRHVAAYRQLSSRLQDAERRVGRATPAFHDAERKHHAARAAVTTAREREADAQRSLAPAPGSLQGVLRQHSDTSWKHDLARVLNPELLHRTDLDPSALPEALRGGFYGWQLNTTLIDPPAWTDDDRLRQALEDARAVVHDAEAKESAAAADLETASAEHTAAQANLDRVQAEELVHNEQERTLRLAVEADEARVEEARKAAREAAGAEVRAVEGEIGQLNEQVRRLKADLAAETKRIEEQFAKLAKDAQGRRDGELAAVDRAVQRLRDDFDQRREEYAEQLREHLRTAGVSPESLEVLDRSIQELQGKLRDLEDKRPLVERWQAWIGQNGPLQVARLATAAKESAEERAAAETALQQHRLAASSRSQAVRDEIRTLEERIAGLDSELAILKALPPLFTDYLPTRHEAVDLHQTAKDLRRAVEKQGQDLQRASAAIASQTSDLIRDLTSRESTTKQLFEGHLLDAGEGTTARARAVVAAHRRLGSQVIHELNNTLRAVLANIGAFHKTIRDFESEVQSFNNNLQTALQDVKRFNRVDELHLHIVADFNELNFYKKLKSMEGLVRQHHGEVGVDLYSDMPPVETAEVLRDFLGVMGRDGALEVDLGAYIALSGSVVENGRRKLFKRASELQGVSSTGLTGLILITLLVGLVNTVRRGENVHVPWVTDEVGTFDPSNFAALLQMLADNRIDVLTASPTLDMNQFAHFRNRYVFEDNGVVRRFALEEDEVVA